MRFYLNYLVNLAGTIISLMYAPAEVYVPFILLCAIQTVLSIREVEQEKP